MSEHKVTIGDKEFVIASPSLDKTMRITDYVAEILEQVPGIFDEMEKFRINYRANHREILTAEDFNNPEYTPVIEALGFTAADFEEEGNLITDETGKTGIAVYQSPSEFETIAAVFPKVWRAARGNISDLCALLLITDGELEEHDKRGAVNALIEQRSHWLRYNATMEQLLELISVGLVIVKEQVETASESLGKVASNLTGILGAEPAQEEEAPETETSAEPVVEQQ
jgi:hypothetical protein